MAGTSIDILGGFSAKPLNFEDFVDYIPTKNFSSAFFMMFLGTKSTWGFLTLKWA